METDRYKHFKYYKGQDVSPYSSDDPRDKMWYGEKVFDNLGVSLEEWAETGRGVKAQLKEQGETEKLARADSYDDTTFGIIVFIEMLFQKNAPMESTEWIFEY